jgi:hypothetical protein
MQKAAVIDLAAFRDKKAAHEQFAGKRKPVASTHGQAPGNEALPERLQKIKTSLERINKLMHDLKSFDKK